MTVVEGVKLGVVGLLAILFVLACDTFANNGRYAFIGASPKGIVVFDTATGQTTVGRPLALTE